MVAAKAAVTKAAAGAKAAATRATVEEKVGVEVTLTFQAQRAIRQAVVGAIVLLRNKIKNPAGGVNRRHQSQRARTRGEAE